MDLLLGCYQPIEEREIPVKTLVNVKSFNALQQPLGRKVIIIIRDFPDQESLDNIYKQHVSFGQQTGPNFIRTVDIAKSGNQLILAVEYLEGKSLIECIKDKIIIYWCCDIKYIFCC